MSPGNLIPAVHMILSVEPENLPTFSYHSSHSMQHTFVQSLLENFNYLVKRIYHTGYLKNSLHDFIENLYCPNILLQLSEN